ncbi:MAG: ATP-binding protein [Acidimicrobiia bacterium]
MPGFIGRVQEIGALHRALDAVEVGAGARRGRCLLIRGRRRVGKSRLVEEFTSRAGVPSVFFAASRQGPREVGLFAAEVADSDLPGRELFAAANPTDWDGALRLLAAALPADRPSIVVIDEFPYLLEADPTLDATFQKQWDRILSKKPVLLLLIGSDLTMMEALNTHGRAFYQRGTEMVVPPLSPAETAAVVGADGPADAFDAYLVTGGLPLVCGEWPSGAGLWRYLEEALGDPTSALVVSAERALAAEFPEDALARTVLEQIGAGERTFTTIQRAAGGLQPTSAVRALDLLTAKRVVARDVPLSTKASKQARYRVADPYLRFWLAFIGPHFAELERGRGDRILARVRAGWTTWRGRAIEPVVREALARLLPAAGLPDAGAVGGYWTRTNIPEVDLVGADRGPVAKKVLFVGTIKWLDTSPLDQGDINTLSGHLAAIPGAGPTTPLVAVSRAGAAAAGAAATFGPADLLTAWR